jgi:hypothetical protein
MAPAELTVMLVVQAVGVNPEEVLEEQEILLQLHQAKEITVATLQPQVVIILLVVAVGQARLVELHLQILLVLAMVVLVIHLQLQVHL